MNVLTLICDTVIKIVSMIVAVPIIIALFIILAFTGMLGVAILLTVYIVTIFIDAHDSLIHRK